MRNLILLAALAIPSAVPAAPSTAEPLRSSAGRDCPNPRLQQADKVRGGAVLRRLDQLPPGRLELGVVREINRCAIPAIVREGIGLGPAAEGDPPRGG